MTCSDRGRIALLSVARFLRFPVHPTIHQLERARRATWLSNSPVDTCIAVKRGMPGVPQDSVG
jgi:hypothetical protein